MEKYLGLDLLKHPEIQEAHALAAEAHSGQTRKYSRVPYFIHPERIFKRFCEYNPVHIFPNGISLNQRVRMGKAILNHDVEEDCPHIPKDRLIQVLGEGAYTVVHLLTNPSKQFPQLLRAERKAIDRKHYMTLEENAPLYAWEVRVIKMMDRIDNIHDIPFSEKSFRRKYAQESKELQKVLAAADPILGKELLEACFMLEKGE